MTLNITALSIRGSVDIVSGANKPFVLSAITMNVIMLSVIMMNVTMLSVIMLSVTEMMMVNILGQKEENSKPDNTKL